jgi:hypothetical protein
MLRARETTNDCLHIGIALGSPVSLDYDDNVPFKFNGKIEQVHVRYLAAEIRTARLREDTKAMTRACAADHVSRCTVEQRQS